MRIKVYRSQFYFNLPSAKIGLMRSSEDNSINCFLNASLKNLFKRVMPKQKADFAFSSNIKYRGINAVSFTVSVCNKTEGTFVEMVKRIPFYVLSADRVNLSLPLYQHIENITEYIAFQNQVRPLLVAVYSTIVLLGVIGNILVMITIIFEKRMRRKATYIFICNLSIADVLFLLISLPISVAIPAVGRWTFGRVWCKAVYYCEHLNGLNSVFTLVGLSADRLYGTLYPFRSKQIRSPRYAYIVCSVIWTLAALFSISSLYSFDTAQVPTTDNATETYCLIDTDSVGLKIKTISIFVYGYLIPLVVLVIIYYVILNHLSVQRASTLRTYSSSSKRDQIRLAERRKVTILAISVVAVFFICWFPFHLYNIIRDVIEIGITIPLGCFHIVAHVLMFTNSALNPVLYAFISIDFRQGLRRRFLCKSVK